MVQSSLVNLRGALAEFIHPYRQELCCNWRSRLPPAAGLAAALTGAGVAFSAQAGIISVDRTHKGDRLSLLPKSTSKVSSPAVTTLAKPPVGCESAFSRIVDPDRAHFFGRCIS